MASSNRSFIPSKIWQEIYKENIHAITILNIKGQIIHANPAAQKLLGLSKDSIRNRTYNSPKWKITTIEGKPFPNEQLPFYRVLKTQRAAFDVQHYIENPQTHKKILLNIQAFPIFSSYQKLDYVVAILNDITEKQKIQDQLEKSELKYRKLFENSPMGIGVANLSGEIIDFNENMTRILGYTAKELKTINVTDLYYEKSERLNILKELQKNGKIRHRELKLKQKSGKIIYTSLNIDFFTLDNTKYILTSLLDITEKKRRENERKQMEKKIQKKLRLESLGLLAGGIAHDFNNLLVGIIGNAELALMEESLDNTIAENLGDILKSAKYAAKLSQQMLLYSGKRQITKYPLNISELIQNMKKLLRDSISNKFPLVINLDFSIPKIFGNEIQIQQILMNLLINASEAFMEKPGTIQISTYKRYYSQKDLKQAYYDFNLSEGDYVALKIQDNGVGIKAETYKKLFEPFHSTKSEGRGLGLSTVLGIVRNHQGTIFVDSQEGKGTKFIILFPIYKGKNQPLPIKKQSSAEQRTKFSDLTVLIVDDNPMVRKVIKTGLSRLGVQSITKSSGKKALAFIKHHHQLISLIILDLTMPDMDGFETLKGIRKITTTIPVVLTSGYTEYDVNQKAQGIDFQGFIHKPYEIKHLEEIIRDLDL